MLALMPIIEIFDDSLSPLMALKKQREYNPISWKERLQAEPACLPAHANPLFVKLILAIQHFLIQLDPRSTCQIVILGAFGQLAD